MRVDDLNIKIGTLPKGKLNKITDVEGIKVGHCTIDNGEIQTGVSAILPSDDNIYTNTMVASSYILNGFGKTIGTVQIEELGELESPILLTNTLAVGVVADSLVKHMVKKNLEENVEMKTFNPVVCECNDSKNNKIYEININSKHIEKAISSAEVDFEEGAIGAGRGMTAHGLKGGIGSASRVIKILDKRYTIGALVMSNHGRLEDFTIAGDNVGVRIKKEIETQNRDIADEQDKGSIIIIMATDMPLTSRQIKRVLKRASVGLARVGSHLGHGSGDVFIGFSTANRMKKTDLYIKKAENIADNDAKQVNDYIQDYKLDIVFRAFIECVEESVLNSMLQAKAIKNEISTVESLCDYIDSVL